MAHTTMSIGGATYDLFVRVPHDVVRNKENENFFSLQLGEKIRVQEVIETCGGGASNTSVGLSRLGCDACFEGVVSSDQWGEKLIENFKKEGVMTEYITVVEDEVSSFSIILSASSGERVILYDSGTNTHLHDVTFDKEAADKMDWVFLNHIQKDSCVIQDDIIEILAGEDGPNLTWNPGGCQIDFGLEPENNKKLLGHTTLLLLNKGEALKFTKTNDTDSALAILLKSGVKNVCITDGKNGVIASDGKELFHCPVVSEQKVVDTTGAGDAFGTGTTWGLLQGLSLPESLKAGSINAASVVRHFGAQTGLLTDIDMRSRLEKTSLDVSINPLP